MANGDGDEETPELLELDKLGEEDAGNDEVVVTKGDEDTAELLELDELGVEEIGDEEVVVVVVRNEVCRSLASIRIVVKDLEDHLSHLLTESVLELEELDELVLKDDVVVVCG